MKKKMRLGTLAMLCVLLLTAASALAECTGDHPFGPWKTKRNPTCRLEGLDFRYCRECDHWEKRYTKKLPHEVEEWTITREPTCTQEGRKEGVCSACKQTVSRRIEMLPHEYGEMTVAVEPTCTQNGKGESFCAVCGHKKTETLAKLGHDWGEVSVTQEPTCAKKGKGEQILRPLRQDADGFHRSSGTCLRRIHRDEPAGWQEEGNARGGLYALRQGAHRTVLRRGHALRGHGAVRSCNHDADAAQGFGLLQWKHPHRQIR